MHTHGRAVRTAAHSAPPTRRRSADARRDPGRQWAELHAGCCALLATIAAPDSPAFPRVNARYDEPRAAFGAPLAVGFVVFEGFHAQKFSELR